jgi:hypothetical protein
MLCYNPGTAIEQTPIEEEFDAGLSNSRRPNRDLWFNIRG